jgi:hypothetical protein
MAKKKSKTFIVTLKLDIELLKKQKVALLNDIDNAWGEHKTRLEGILSLLDGITDQISDKDYGK